ncbi:autotransporter assembly complex protein TamA [Sphingomonas sp. SRS2]|uniref:autotransporter assembly complex protein TamA n=1 Tax=Sphingomonas sp. SRS2 TaxID=133190 RepID=UPI0006184A0A|nr:BamA/TamA family outer membrane protein [Sphingomonas sp. SRS2]KKC27453.1 outer membrane protein [Sphingomonas sp. SRS2]
MSAPRTLPRAPSIILGAMMCVSVAAQAQPQPTPSTSGDQAVLPDLDPSSEMAPLPDMEVEWPDPLGDGGSAAAVPSATPVESLSSDIQADRRYRVAIDGLTGQEGLSADTEAAIRGRFRTLSALEEGKGVGNTAQIDRRAREDEALLEQLMRAAGFYDADISTRIEDETPGRLAVTLNVEPGALYTLSAVDLPGIEKAGEDSDELRTAFGLAVGAPADSDRIAAGQLALRAELGRQGFVFAKVGEPKLTVNHDEHHVALVMDVDSGGAQRIGRIVIEDQKLFSAKHLGRIARFRSGEVYDAAKMDDFRRALIQTSLVSTVTIKPIPTTDPHVVDISVKLEPAPPRTISGSVGYGTGEGYRLEASWQHRNLIRPEGGVTFRGVLGTQEQSLGAVLRRNNYKARDRVLTGQLLFSHLQEDAFEARSVTLAAGLERQTNIIWQKKWTWSYGAEITASKEDDTVKATGAPRRRQYLTGALPSSLSYDGSDDLLNPTRGYRLAARISPELSLQGSAFGYVKAQVDGSTYLPVGGRTVIAGRARLGSIMGAAAERIAPTRRFYAGGGGSVRGFGYQKIGPIDVNGDPAGGRSLAEFSIEARIRFGDFGVVPFLDAGNLYSARLPTFRNLRYGAGIGVRYYTSFGPIRVDLGTPIDRRRGDSRVAIYVSLGQAF